MNALGIQETLLALNTPVADCQLQILDETVFMLRVLRNMIEDHDRVVDTA